MNLQKQVWVGKNKKMTVNQRNTGIKLFLTERRMS